MQDEFLENIWDNLPLFIVLGIIGFILFGIPREIKNLADKF